MDRHKSWTGTGFAETLAGRRGGHNNGHNGHRNNRGQNRGRHWVKKGAA